VQGKRIRWKIGPDLRSGRLIQNTVTEMPMGQHYDIGSRSATRLAGQNVRGLTQLKLNKVVQIMIDQNNP
jgi:hypothetical protein